MDTQKGTQRSPEQAEPTGNRPAPCQVLARPGCRHVATDHVSPAGRAPHQLSPRCRSPTSTRVRLPRAPGATGLRDRAARPGVPATTMGLHLMRQGSPAAALGVSVTAAEADQPPPPGPDAKAGSPCPGKAQSASRGGSKGNAQMDSVGWGLSQQGQAFPRHRPQACPAHARLFPPQRDHHGPGAASLSELLSQTAEKAAQTSSGD